MRAEGAPKKIALFRCENLVFMKKMRAEGAPEKNWVLERKKEENNFDWEENSAG